MTTDLVRNAYLAGLREALGLVYDLPAEGAGEMLFAQDVLRRLQAEIERVSAEDWDPAVHGSLALQLLCRLNAGS